MVKKQDHTDYETELVSEGYSAIQEAIAVALGGDPTRWSPIMYTIWRLRVPLIRYLLVMKMGYYITRKTITTRLLTIDARTGAAAAYEKIRAAAGYNVTIGGGHGPSRSIMGLTLRPVPLTPIIYDFHYLVNFTPDRRRIAHQFVNAGSFDRSEELPPILLYVQLGGGTLEDLQINIRTPWRIQSTGHFSIKDKRPIPMDILSFVVNSVGIEDEKEIASVIPRKILQNFHLYDISTTELSFRYDLVPSSQFQNVVLASLVHSMPPITSFRIVLHLNVDIQRQNWATMNWKPLPTVLPGPLPLPEPRNQASRGSLEPMADPCFRNLEQAWSGPIPSSSWDARAETADVRLAQNGPPGIEYWTGVSNNTEPGNDTFTNVDPTENCEGFDARLANTSIAQEDAPLNTLWSCPIPSFYYEFQVEQMSS